jgi:hypothetical protein
VLEADAAAGAAGALGAVAGLASLLEEEVSLDEADDLAESVLDAESLFGLLSLSLEDFCLAWL